MNDDLGTDPEELRSRAEARVNSRPELQDRLSREEAITLVHELKVHQVELELQNEELLRTQDLLAESRDKYQLLYDLAPNGYVSVNESAFILDINQSAALMLMQTRNNLLNTKLTDYIAETDQDTFHMLRQKVSQSYGNPQAEIHLRRSDGQIIVTQMTGRLFYTQTDHPRLYFTITDIGEIKEAQIAEGRQRALAEALRDSALALSRTLDLESVFDEILQQVARVIHCDVAELLLFDGARVFVANTWSRSSQSDEVNDGSMGISPILQQMMETQQPVIIPDLLAETSRTSYPRVFASVRSYLGIPIFTTEEQVLGFISLYATQSDYFSATHGAYLEQFASHVALAMKNTQLIMESQKLALIEQQQRLARELHDNVTQMLFSASIIAEGLMKSNDIGQIKEHLQNLHRLNRGALGEMNNLLLELRSDGKPSINLSHILKQLATAVAGRSDIDVTTHLESSMDLPVDTQLGLYRIARYALNNVVNHSFADQVRLSLENKNGHVIMVIEDNGQGFDTSEINLTGGFAAIKRIAESSGMDLNIFSRIEVGTRIEITWDRGQIGPLPSS